LNKPERKRSDKSKNVWLPEKTMFRWKPYFFGPLRGTGSKMMDIVDIAIQVGGSVICFENITSELW
jgi:hypothetical protein